MRRYCGRGEFAELPSDDGELWMFVPHVRDLLDEARSCVARFDSGRIMYATRYAFGGAGLAEVTTFRVPQLATGPAFFSGRLVEALAAERGVTFAEVWPVRVDRSLKGLP
ncbi:hypothetical protein OHA72_59160 [Dactylosporangium sp. NBC_01737]|uniref:hypothetical protein n=1 Tax=Dactylosporangium sp. NBC_01737 TaxID=2975959 RepID=UPI002E0DDD5D|nr:hypothetical protein OHA72_59160 [Dactylosporangium sp. NBC_01737]